MLSNNDDEIPTPTKGIVIEIPLKPRKKMISLRIDEEALIAIDKFVARSGDYSRTLILTRLIEAFAEGLRRLNYNASKVQIKVVSENSFDSVEIVIPLKSSKP